MVRRIHARRASRRRAPVLSDYDVIVLGAGAPGEHCAGALAEGGLRVAVVERELVGGECSYWACIPSKTLLRPGEATHGANEAAAQRPGRRRRDVRRGGTSWSRTTPTPAPRYGSRTGASTCSGAHGRLGRTGRGRGRRRAAHRSAHRRRQRRRAVHPTGARAPRARGGVDQPRGHRHDRSPASPRDPRGRTGRRRDGTGGAAAGRRGHAGRRRCARARQRTRAVGHGTGRGPGS